MHYSSYVTLAAVLLPAALARPMPQIGGDAQACYGIVNNVDNGSGYAIENAEDNAADLYSGKPTGSDSQGGGGGSSITRRDLVLLARQLNKISNGFGTLGDALGLGVVANPIAADGNNIDGVGTNDQGQAGDQIGADEDNYIPSAANDATNLDPNGNLPALDSVPDKATSSASNSAGGAGAGGAGGQGAQPAPAGGNPPPPKGGNPPPPGPHRV